VSELYVDRYKTNNNEKTFYFRAQKILAKPYTPIMRDDYLTARFG
jgi:hypothetical protein